jgi:hypothetical protein
MDHKRYRTNSKPKLKPKPKEMDKRKRRILRNSAIILSILVCIVFRFQTFVSLLQNNAEEVAVGMTVLRSSNSNLVDAGEQRPSSHSTLIDMPDQAVIYPDDKWEEKRFHIDNPAIARLRVPTPIFVLSLPRSGKLKLCRCVRSYCIILATGRVNPPHASFRYKIDAQVLSGKLCWCGANSSYGRMYPPNT